MKCERCGHDRRLHSLYVTVREAQSLDVQLLRAYAQAADGQCLVWKCECLEFLAPPLTVVLDRELAREFVDAIHSYIDRDWQPPFHVADAIRRALEAQP